MKVRPVARILQSQAVSEGAGVTVRRSIGTQTLRNLDPFLMLDHFGSDNPNEYIAGFPDHPHRGFVTFTYMLDGHMLHQDSMGNRGDLHAGGAQWMKAAAGVIHSEMPQQTHGLMRGFQLWINLPAREKMAPPEYQEFTPEAIPEIESDGARIRIIAGEHSGHKGVIQDPFSKVKYLDVRLAAHSSFTTDVPSGFNAFAYVFEGHARSEGTSLPNHSFVLFGEGESITIQNDSQDTRFILVAGQPIDEPIVQYGPFVMNTREEIEQAFADYQSGKFARIKADVKGR